MTAVQKNSRTQFLISMCIFGTIGIFRRYIPLPSSMIALVRGVIGCLFLLLVIALSQQRIQKEVIRQNFPLLALSGAAIGFNWILLFEAYNYTSVAAATLCYYLAPILVILAAPVLLHEKLTVKKILCAVTALGGMILVSGITDVGFSGTEELKGIFFGLGAAVLYASVILMNKKMPQIPAYDKTIFQLAMASVALLPYVLLTEDLAAVSPGPMALLLLLIAGIIHTGVAYWLYFSSMGNLPSQTIALLSYLDPILAILLSVVILQEPMTTASGIGAVMILAAAYISEK